MVIATCLTLGLHLTSAAQAEVDLDRADSRRYAFEWRPGLEGFARALLAVAEDHHDRIYGDLGLDPSVDDSQSAAEPRRTRVTLLSNAAEMLEVVGTRKKSRPPEWASGLAYPHTREIFLHAAVGFAKLDETFQHEISHIAMGRLAPSTRVPRWFREGVAIWQSESLSFERMRLLTESALVDRLLPLRDLERGFPASGPRAGVAYAQAVHFVGFLHVEYGRDRFGALIAGLRAGDRPFGEVVNSVYGVPLRSLERRWHDRIQLRWGWLPVVFGSSTLWVMATVLLIVAWRRRVRQRSARLKEMAALEAIDMAEDIEIAHNLRPPDHTHDPYRGGPPTVH